MPELSPITVAFLAFPGVTQLDLTGPAQLLSRLGNTTIHLVWKSRDSIPTDAGFSLLPTATFAELPAAEVICIPGGLGVASVIEDDEAMEWVTRVGRAADWVTSVCTGSLILGAAGLLEGYQATTHWAWHHHLGRFGAEPVKARTVIDRNRATGGGVTAGIDFALALTAAIRGEAHARLVQLSLEYDPQPPFDSGAPERAGERLVAAYHRRVDALAPNRDAELLAAAARRGYG